MVKIETSKKNILSIEEFMENYIGISYDGPFKLTHHVMEEYLISKKGILLNHVNFKKVNKVTIANGSHLLVRDNNHQVLVYENPKSYNLDYLMASLNSEYSSQDLKKIRSRELREIGYREISTGEVVEEDAFLPEQQITCKVNRQKTKCYSHKR